MMTFRRPQYAPPGGVYFYDVPETKRHFQRLNMLDLEREVVAHLVASGIKVPINLRAVIEHYMCERLPEGLCDGSGSAALRHLRQPNYFEVLNALPAQLGGGKFVDARTAESRATTCRTCPFNNLSLCTSCNDLQQQTTRYVGGREVMQLRYMGVCAGLRVPTYGLVWIAQPKAVEGLPAECWITAKGAPTHA
jgi:hypothetical protein